MRKSVGIEQGYGTARIWAVGGGKGGTGKSFIAANLGVLLAEKALNTNLVDVDLGAPNLHTFLGIRNPAPNLGDFLHQKGAKLSQFALATPIPSLRLVSGPTKTLFANNLRFFQKRKLINHIRRLEGTITLVDIGAGSAFNTLDFFLISDVRLVVMTPDPASVENAYLFLRAATLRTLETSVRKLGIEGMLDQVIESRHSGPRSIPELLNKLAHLDRGCAQILMGSLEQRNTYLILNKVRDNSAEAIGHSICDVAKKCLGIPLRYLGAVAWDEAARDSMFRSTPHAKAFPRSKTVQALRSMVETLLDFQTRVGNQSQS
jgi:flagellar biosynthesis protein FlhG